MWWDIPNRTALHCNKHIFRAVGLLFITFKTFLRVWCRQKQEWTDMQLDLQTDSEK
jgi:hypothetical protein